MTDARTMAWANLMSAAHAFSTADGKETRLALSREAMAWAAVNGPQRVATGERSAAGGDGMVMPFGRDKGKRLSELDERSLLWWKAVYERDIADAAKTPYLERNQRALDAVNERLADLRRGEP